MEEWGLGFGVWSWCVYEEGGEVIATSNEKEAGKETV
jgi:hypothetical protein